MVEGGVEELPVSPEEAGEISPREARRSETLARWYLSSSHALVPGNRFTLLRDGIEAYPAMIDAIRSAQRRIRLETYMFIDDAVGELFARELCEAARRGV